MSGRVLLLLAAALGCGVENGGLAGGTADAGADAPLFVAPRADAAAGAAGGAAGMAGAALAGRGGGGGAGGMAGTGGMPAPGATAGVIECSAARCSAATQVCCATAVGGTCSSGGGGCAAGAAPRRCDGPEDCKSGEICCARAEGTGGLYRTTCGRGDGCNVGFAMCHGAADCPGQRCCAVTVAPGVTLSLCRATCP